MGPPPLSRLSRRFDVEFRHDNVVTMDDGFDDKTHVASLDRMFHRDLLADRISLDIRECLCAGRVSSVLPIIAQIHFVMAEIPRGVPSCRGV